MVKYNRILIHSFAFVLASALPVCSVAQEQTADPQATQPQATVAPEIGTPRAIRISTGDLLEISVFGLPELNRSVRVNSMGEVSLPLVGAVGVNGLTAEEAQTKIGQAFVAQNYLRDPQVSVQVKEFATQGISVLGEVIKPGTYPLFGPVRLLDALSSAGGLTQRAGRKVMISHRDQALPPMTVVLALNDPTAGSNVELIPGDTVVVAKAGIVYVVGNVEKPGGFIMDNNESLTVLQAIALAQGANRTAALDKAKLIRTTVAGRQEISIPLSKILASKSPDLPLAPDDIIFVPSSASRNVAKRTLDAMVATLPGLAVYTAAR